MALQIEDGTGKADAQSYVDAAAATAYALSRGVVLDAPNVEPMLLKAMDYLESFRGRFQGAKTWPAAAVASPAHDAQALQWPRTGVVIDCLYELPDNVIPNELKQAQMQCCVEQQNGFDLQQSTDGTVVKRKKVDVLEKEFFSAADLGLSGTPVASFPAVDALLAPLFAACGGGGLRTVRV